MNTKKKPGILILVWRLATCVKWASISLSGKIGFLLLILNVPLGWGGAAICGALAMKCQNTAFWGAMAISIYAISWVMLGLGACLAGKNLRQQISKRKKYILGAWRRIRAMCD